MARILKIKELEERRRALAEESEVYRQMLKLEVQNMRLYSVGMRRKFTSVRSAQPLIMLALPLLGSLFRRRKPKRSKMRLVGMAFMGWQLVQKLGPLAFKFFAMRNQANRTARAEARVPAAVI